MPWGRGVPSEGECWEPEVPGRPGLFKVAPSCVLFPFKPDKEPPQSQGCLCWALVTALGCGGSQEASGKGRLCRGAPLSSPWV